MVGMKRGDQNRLPSGYCVWMSDLSFISLSLLEKLRSVTSCVYCVGEIMHSICTEEAKRKLDSNDNLLKYW